jgi:hypothetical protein
MKRNDKQRLFEVMGRLDKTFKPKLNEGFEEIEATDDVALPAETGEETPELEEKSPEEKLAELTAKIDSLYAMVHGDEEGEEDAEAEEEKLEGEPVGEPEEMGVEGDELENLQEWNFDKKKGDKKDEKEEEKEEDEKEEVDEVKEEKKSKVPVAAIPKVGK